MATKTARLEARIPNRVKKRAEEAARLRGRSLSEFVIEALDREASAVLEEREVLEVHARAQRSFVSFLLAPAQPPSDRLRAAKERYDRAVVRE